MVEHRLVLSSCIVEELLDVTRRRFPDKMEVIDLLLSQLPYELIYMPERPEPGLFEIRDEEDYPILYPAVAGFIDVFITGDKDFYDLDLENPEIISPVEFLERH